MATNCTAEAGEAAGASARRQRARSKSKAPRGLVDQLCEIDLATAREYYA
jgi:hypothetical protein